MIQRLLLRLPRLSIMVLATLFISSLFAQAFARNDYHAVNWDNLDLSNQQKDHLNELDNEWKSSVTVVAPRIQTKEQKLKKLMGSSSADDGEILRLQEEIHEDKTKLKVQATQIFLHKRKVLNNEQQEKLRQMLDMH